MAVHHSCDGCGAHLADGEHAKAGFVIVRDYCAECSTIAKQYQAEIDALHERLASTWTTELTRIRAAYAAMLADLPDVPSPEPKA